MSGVVLPVVLLLLGSAPGLARSSGPGLTWALADPDSAVHQGEAVDVSALWDHLHSLKEMVLRLSQQAVDQRLTLRSMETRVQDQQIKFQKHSEQIQGLETLQVQLNTTRDQLLGLTWSRTDDLEQQNSAQDAQLLALETRMEAREAEVDDLKNKNTVLSAELLGELPFLKTRLRASESTLEQQRRRNAVFPVVRPGDGTGAPGGSELAELQTRMGSCSAQLEVLQNQSRDTLVSMESRLLSMETRLVSAEMSLDSAPIQVEPPMAENTDQKSMLSALEVQMNASAIWTEAMESRARSNETTLLELQKQVSGVDARAGVLSRLWAELHTNTTDPTRVAFSAGLTDSGAVGPFADETTLVYSKTLTNIGQAYNQTTGIFSAPVRGLYCFLFTVADFLNGYRGVYLYRNAQRVFFSLELNAHGGYASSSTGVPLLLEAGDNVYLRLPGSYRLYDDNRNFSLFSGFLLFPL
ncbi:unnamed protein product [Merluccius merluccius]